MSDLMFAMLLWIGDHSHYDDYLSLPNIAQTEPYNLCAQYGINNKQRCEMQRLVGFFNKDLTIYMHQNFTADTPHRQSQLLHELVHYVQWANMSPNESYCLGQMEHEAYLLQNQWRAQQGLEPVSDEFTLMMLAASCED